MRFNGPLPWIGGLIVGVSVVSLIMYSTYRSMESDISEATTSSSHSPTSLQADSRKTISASRAHPDNALSASSLSTSSTASISSTQNPTNQETVAEEIVDASPPLPPPIPGAFAAAKLANMPDVDQERLADIAQDFADKVKAAGWDTTSPAYHDAWKKAAEESEDSLKTAIGVQAWQELKMRQAQED